LNSRGFWRQEHPYRRRPCPVQTSIVIGRSASSATPAPASQTSQTDCLSAPRAAAGPGPCCC